MSEAPSGPKTWWSGESSPDDKSNSNSSSFIFVLIVLAVSPIAVITAVLSYLSFTRWRIHHAVIAQAATLFTFLFAITGLLTYSATHYMSAFSDLTNMITGKSDEGVNVSSILVHSLLVQTPLSLVIGAWVGTLYCTWRWWRRSVWQESNFRLTPFQWWKKKKAISNIQEDKDSPRNGATLGITDRGEKIVQTYQEGSAHTLFLGASGAGKSTTALMLARDHIKQGNGYIFIDLKGGTDIPNILADYAHRYGRRFQHFMFQNTKVPYTGPAADGPAYYDPLARGDASRRKDMLISGRRWSEEYYKIITAAYLQTAFDVMIGAPPNIAIDALGDIANLLNPGNLAARSRDLPMEDPYYDDVREEVHKITSKRLENTEKSAIDGMLREIQTIRNSTAGRWLRLHQDPERNIDIYRAAKRGDVVVFSLDALTYPEIASLIANLVISDLKTVTGEMNANSVSRPLIVFIDEFAAINSENITGLINKARSAGMAISLATQALGDLRRVDPAFMDQLLGIINCFAIHRANTLDDAEVLSGIIGKDDKWEVRLGIEHTSGTFGSIGKGAATGQGTLDKKNDFVVQPKVIQGLKAGEVIYVAKSPDSRVIKLKVIEERADMTSEAGGGATSVHGRETMPMDSPYPIYKTFDEEPLPLPSTIEEQNTNREYESNNPSILPQKSRGVLEGRDLRSALSGHQSPPPSLPSAPRLQQQGERVHITPRPVGPGSIPSLGKPPVYSPTPANAGQEPPLPKPLPRPVLSKPQVDEVNDLRRKQLRRDDSM